MATTDAEEAELHRLLEEEELDAVFEPQPGPQRTFLETQADIALYGGAAGSGKSHALLLENLRHIDNGKFGSVIFRRESTQITTEGGLWDSAMSLYPLRGARPRFTPRHQMIFPSGAKVSFAHLQYEADVFSYQGAQIPLLCYDELTHFTRRQFFYMLSRNRSTCGVKPYVRATTNPDSDSWVAKLVDWWIDADGFAIPERSGVLRYFVVLDDEMRWADTPDELAATYGVSVADAKSFTFIAASIYDNRILLQKDPTYLANLKALSTVERGRLLHGNWKIRPSEGMYFRRDQVSVVPTVPSCGLAQVCRAWDLAATTPTPDNPSPDATAGVLLGRLADGRYIVLDVVHGRWSPHDVRARITATASRDRDQHPGVRIRLPQDPGQAGKEQAQSYLSMLSGHAVKIERVTGGKVTRAEPLASQWQGGNVLVLQAPWNEHLFTELEAFPDGAHDDLVDAAADAFAEVALSQAPISETRVTTYDDILSVSYEGFFS